MMLRVLSYPPMYSLRSYFFNISDSSINFLYYILNRDLLAHVMDNAEKINLLEKRLFQLEQRIRDEKTYERTKEAKRKRSLGTMLIMPGATQYYNPKDYPFNFVIVLGSLFYIVGIESKFKLSILLGACFTIFQKVKDDNELKNELVKNGKLHYEQYTLTKERKTKDDALEYPLDFFLGVVIAAKEFILIDKNIDYCHEVGDKIFTERRNRKMQKT